MRLGVVVCVLVLLLAEALADSAVNNTESTDQEEDEYEDIAVAETQDIAHRQFYPKSDDPADQPRSRPRGRKRRRRLRKRPRSTTPSFVEEYDPGASVKEEEQVHPEEENPYQRRRPVKDEDKVAPTEEEISYQRRRPIKEEEEAPLGEEEVPYKRYRIKGKEELLPEEAGVSHQRRRPINGDEELSPVEEEVPYQRRRPAKRRRRPSRRKPEYGIEVVDPDVDPELQQTPETHAEDYHRPRNSQRRRRKGGRKRIRVTTETSLEPNNNNEESLGEVTTQQPEVVMQMNNNSPGNEQYTETSASSLLDETTESIFSKAFTTKEITEINHELESLSRLPSENEYQVSGLGAFSGFQTTVTDTTTRKNKENHVETTTKEYSWITRFDPQSDGKLAEEVTTQDALFGVKEEKKDSKEPRRNIKNIEKIIENRKHLFSTSKRLPPTSAVIRRRLRPQIESNLTTTEETIIDNTIPTVNPSNLKFGKKECKDIDCALNRTRILSNIIPSSLIPSGFPTMPEVLSTAELIQKTTKRLNNYNANELPHIETESDSQNRASDSVIIITPSTLIRSENNNENLLVKDYIYDVTQQTSPHEELTTKIYITSPPFALSSKENNHTIEMTSSSSVTKVTTNIEAKKENQSRGQDLQSDEAKEEEKLSKTEELERLRLDGVDVSNINDEILEFIMDEMGKARVKRILELRNMTLSELIAHRERGAGHFSTFNEQNPVQNRTKNYNSTKLSIQQTTENTDSKQESMDQENTEKMIVEKARLFLNEFKKSDESNLNIRKSTQKKDKDSFSLNTKTERTANPTSVIDPTYKSTIQFPEDGILGAFPKYMYDIAGKKSKANTPVPNEKPSLFRESINKPKEMQPNEKREPRVFESMPQFNSETSNKENLEMFPYPDWRISVSNPTTDKHLGFPGISKEIMLVATSRSTSKSANLEEVILLDEGEEVHHLRNHILGGKINVDSDEDYSETKKVPASVKSAIAASGALLGLAIFGFLAVLVSCKIRQRRARLRARRDILCEHLAEDFHNSQRSRTPVLRKSPFNNGIHSNTASNRHYYLWRTLRKTFQYE